MPTTQQVVLGERSYPIHIGTGLLDRAGDVLAPVMGRRAVIITNATVAAYQLGPLRAGLANRGVETDVVMVPDGEAHKSWPALQDIITRLLELRVDRGVTLIALGGGVIGDLAGFAAAITLRGLAFVQIPTKPPRQTPALGATGWSPTRQPPPADRRSARARLTIQRETTAKKQETGQHDEEHVLAREGKGGLRLTRRRGRLRLLFLHGRNHAVVLSGAGGVR